MPYTRRILHFSPGPGDLVGPIAGRAVAGAWFELYRQGGCGAGELRLRDGFPERDAVDVGDWIAFEYEDGVRWYLGRVEEREARSPAGVRLRLEGPAVELGEVFPGGFGRTAAYGVPPHRYANTDLFPHDPDHSDETVDSVDAAPGLVLLLMQQYVMPATHVLFDPALIEAPDGPAEVVSLKFRGEESVRSILKELALRARSAAWGVRADRTFFFLRPRDDVIATYREGRDLTLLEETRDRDLLFNRVLLTGDYVYGEAGGSEVVAPGFYRWRGNYVQPASREKHGERRIRLWVPWIRTATDARAFAREFFRAYAEPATRWLIEAAGQPDLPLPWEGRVRIEARDGSEIATARVETVRVQFDHAPRLRLELGPEDPRLHWPEPPHDERWEAASRPVGSGITIETSTTGESSSATSSQASSDSSSAVSELSDMSETSSGSSTVTGSTGESSSGLSSDGPSTGASASSEGATSEVTMDESTTDETTTDGSTLSDSTSETSDASSEATSDLSDASDESGLSDSSDDSSESPSDASSGSSDGSSSSPLSSAASSGVTDATSSDEASDPPASSEPSGPSSSDAESDSGPGVSLSGLSGL